MSTEEKRNAAEEYAAVRQHARKTRRRLLTVLSIVLGIVLLLGAAVALLGELTEPKQEIPEYDFEFYPPYEGNIMENDEYLELNRSISYCADPLGYGLTQSITDDNRQDMDVGVLFLCDWLQTIIAGDHMAYNAMFSQAYLFEAGEQAAFFPQMLYQMQINFMNEKKEGEDRLVTYRINYMIHRNDGSFRRDIESDASRPQDVTVRIFSDGSAQIEQLITYHEKK